MSGSSVNLAGTLKITTARRIADVALTEVIDGLDVLQFDFMVAQSASNVAVTFPSSEALVLHLYSPAKLILELTGSDTIDGPIRVGLKGHLLLTCQPGEGIVSLRVTNPDAVNNVVLEVVIGIAANGEIPEFFE